MFVSVQMPELVALVNKVRLRRAMLIDWPTKYPGNIGAGQEGEAEKSDADRARKLAKIFPMGHSGF